MKTIFTFLLMSIYCVSYATTNQTLKTIYFANDSYEISEESKQFLLEHLEEFKQVKLEIKGYTDINGSENYNLELSQKRADAVQSFLIKNGIYKGDIKLTKGLGESSFYPTLAQNRRVDIIIGKGVVTETVLEEKIEPKPIKPEIKSSQNLSEITAIEIGKTLAVKNLNFIPGRHFLMPQSEPILKELLQILIDNPTLKIEIQGHICCQPGGGDGVDNDTGKLELSVNRAKYIYQYLVDNGIDKSRLSYKGYGADNPLVPEIDAETRQMNRRVEILIIDK